jgi:hypothetical protein
MTQKTRNRLALILVLGIPTAIFVCSIFYNAFHLTPPPPMPNPNGYDDLMKAARMVSPKVDGYSTSNVDDLQAIVSTNAHGLEVARTGLKKQCRIPLDYDPNITAGMIPIGDVKNLALAFAAEGDLAEIQGHSDEAAKSYLDIVHLANESSRGGVLIDELVAIAIEKIGTSNLQHLTPQLNAKACRETAATLETLDDQRQQWDDIMWQEHYWSRRAFPGIRNEIERMMQYKEIQKVDQDAQKEFEDQQARTRKLIIDLAARAYESDKGHPPATVSDLLTNYLKTIPIDPVTGTNMSYLPK